MPVPVRGVITATELSTDAAVVWARATTPAGVNDELSPWVRMTVPPGWRRRSLVDLAVPAHLGPSWLLLAGLVPFERDDLTIAELGPGFRFVERSTLLAYRTWVHERVVEPRPAGCLVEDRVGFALRRRIAWVPGLARLHLAVIRRLFEHRHRRLARTFGAPAATRTRQSLWRQASLTTTAGTPFDDRRIVSEHP